MMQMIPAPMATMAIPMGPVGTMGPVQGAMPMGIQGMQGMQGIQAIQGIQGIQAIQGIQCQVLVPVAMVSIPMSPAPSTVASTSVGSETGSEGLLDTAWVAGNRLYPTNGTRHFVKFFD